MILFIMVCKNAVATGASEYILTLASESILTLCASPVLIVFAQNHQMIENSQTSMSNTGVVQLNLSKYSYENKTKKFGFDKMMF